MNSNRENYYILLELDPSILDVKKIEEAIKTKQSEWSKKRNNPASGDQAQSYLDQLKDIREVMLDDSTLRMNESNGARDILRKKKLKENEKLTGFINVMAKKGFFDEREVKTLAKKFKHFNESEIRSRIESKFKICPDSTQQNSIKKDVIDQTTINGIEKELKIISKTNLYDFLDMKPKNSLDALRNQISKKSNDIQKNNNKNAILTAQQSLIGYCLKIFKDEAERKKYDNSLSLENIRELEKEIDIIGSSETIYADSWQHIINLARTKGIPVDEAESCIVEYAKKKGWSIEKPTTSSENKLVLCGNCNSLNDTDSKNCVNCNEDLFIQCIDCNTMNLSENNSCSNCGFSFADYFIVKKLLRKADLKIEQNDWFKAKLLLSEAEQFWSNSEQILKMKRKISIEEEKANTELSQVESLIISSQLYQAKKILVKIKQKIKKHSQIDLLETQITNAINKTQSYIAKAEHYESSGDINQAMDCYLDALQICKDDPLINNKLASIAPPPPSSLTIHELNFFVTLKWEGETKGHVKFRVIRKENSPPAHIEDGVILSETTELFYEDKNCQPGIGYYYAIFSIRAGVFSQKPAASSRPVLYVPDVSDLHVKSSNGQIYFQWKPVKNAIYFEIWKKMHTIPESTSESKCFQTKNYCFVDKEVEVDQTYGYLIFSVFEYKKQIIKSKGLGRLATPKSPPKPVTDLNYTVSGNSIELVWTPPESTEKVHIYKSQKEPQYKSFSSISNEEMPQLGVPLLTENFRASVEISNDDRFLFFTPISQQESTFIIGNFIMFSNIEDISEVSTSTSGGQIKLKWLWPKSINHVAILFKENVYPIHPNDSDTNVLYYTREKYERNSGFKFDENSSEMIYVTILSAVKDGNQWLYSSGNKPNCRICIPGFGKTIIEYYVKHKKKFGLFNSNQYELVLNSNRDIKLPHLVLIAKRRNLPIRLNDGTTIININNNVKCTRNQPLKIPFDSHDLPKNAKIRLFSVNDEDHYWIKLKRLQSISINT